MPLCVCLCGCVCVGLCKYRRIASHYNVLNLIYFTSSYNRPSSIGLILVGLDEGLYAYLHVTKDYTQSDKNVFG